VPVTEKHQSSPAKQSDGPAFGYLSRSKRFDELLRAPGEAREHWGDLMAELNLLGPSEFRHRAETSRRLVQEQGITYNVYGDARGMERPWQHDPLPVVMNQREFQGIEKALTQRATLINKVIADAYGPQELIRSAWLPPALLFGQPEFMRPAHGIQPPGGTFLHFYAADLARSPDGQWWVVSDRTQIPTGAGYALANRLVTSRILPEAFRDCRVQRLAGYFRGVQSALARLTPRKSEEPRVVVLTPGPFNETYFEQAYLARYLGYSLVEGQDLTVRDGRVFLKTLSGLEPVDVILRRVDDDFCDPLELRKDSILGVPGLVEVLRAGNVAVANALGCGILQSPALMAFLPGLCRHVLGEELLMPSVATWWCGQKTAEQHVLENLDRLQVRPAIRARAGIGYLELSRAELARRIQFQPHVWAAQEKVQYSTVPAWDGTQFVPRPLLLRVYLVATENGYRVMPGGLARIGAGEDSTVVSMQCGGSSKDVWVMSAAPVDELTLLSSGKSGELRRVGNNLPSRLADNFFWLGRYAERADATARLLRSALTRFHPEAATDPRGFIRPLLEALESQGQLKVTPKMTSAEAIEAELLAAVYESGRPGSLRSLGERIEQLALFVRDRTSIDVWRALHQVGECVTPDAEQPAMAQDAVGAINRLLLLVASFYGFARENMTRAQGWRFIDMGQRIERSIYLCTLLDRALRSEEADNPSLLEALLDVADSTLTYRSRYSLMPNIAAVYDLVLLDDTNPRSLIFQLLQLVKHFEKVPRESQTALPSVGQRILIEAVARVRLLDPRELLHSTEAWHESETATVIRDSLEALPRLAEAIAVSYFAHSAIFRA
jgi:uncharacterized circularly permuted ATP-grasp superfamily protein/uncharacterized alpha-E superfamily protein